jgi:hypothetical protein
MQPPRLRQFTLIYMRSLFVRFVYKREHEGNSRRWLSPRALSAPRCHFQINKLETQIASSFARLGMSGLVLISVIWPSGYARLVVS